MAASISPAAPALAAAAPPASPKAAPAPARGATTSARAASTTLAQRGAADAAATDPATPGATPASAVPGTADPNDPTGGTFASLIQSIETSLENETVAPAPGSGEGSTPAQSADQKAPIPAQPGGAPRHPRQFLKGIVPFPISTKPGGAARALPKLALAGVTLKVDDAHVLASGDTLPQFVSSVLLTQKPLAGARHASVEAQHTQVNPASAERLQQTDQPAIEIKVKDAAAQAGTDAVTVSPELVKPSPVPVVPVAETITAAAAPAVAAPQPPASSVSAAPALTAPVTPEAPAATPRPAPVSAPEPAAYVAPEPPAPPPNAAQQVRSVAIEFAADGTRDVKLRLAERSGEVHISVHTNDPALTGALREGVHDLAGVLAKAGYDAEAWSSGQQQQQQQQFQDEQRQRRQQRRPDEYSSERFDLDLAGIDAIPNN